MIPTKPDKNIEFKPLHEENYYLLEEFMYLAIFVPPGNPPLPQNIIFLPEIYKYIKDFGKSRKDISICAKIDHQILGIIWARTFDSRNKGYGYIADDIPEIAMAVLPEFRGLGIGTKLLWEIENHYVKLGTKALSLSVDKLNPAHRLYKRNGYEFVSQCFDSVTMKKIIKAK